MPMVSAVMQEVPPYLPALSMARTETLEASPPLAAYMASAALMAAAVPEPPIPTTRISVSMVSCLPTFSGTV